VLARSRLAFFPPVQCLPFSPTYDFPFNLIRPHTALSFSGPADLPAASAPCRSIFRPLPSHVILIFCLMRTTCLDRVAFAVFLTFPSSVCSHFSRPLPLRYFFFCVLLCSRIRGCSYLRGPASSLTNLRHPHLPLLSAALLSYLDFVILTWPFSPRFLFFSTLFSAFPIRRAQH